MLSPCDPVEMSYYAYPPSPCVPPPAASTNSGISSLIRPEDWSLASKFALASVGSQGTVGGLLLAGMVQHPILIIIYSSSLVVSTFKILG